MIVLPLILTLAGASLVDEFGDLDGAVYYRNVPDRSNLAHDVEPLGVTVVVSHREFLLGCHTFDRFIDPRWETYYVFDAEIVQNWGLRALAARQTAETTRGVHVVELHQGHLGGAQISRLILLLDLDNRGVATPEFVMGVNCDIQSLPKWHDWYKSFRDQLEMMVTDFREDKALRASGRTIVEQFPIEEYLEWHFITGQKRDLYEQIQRQAPTAEVAVMSTIMMETIASKHNLGDAVFHGVDIGQWQKRGGDKGWRPEEFKDKHWISDTSTWPEDHLVLYDSRKLRVLIQDLRRTGTSVIEMDRLLPQILAKKNWSMVRHNDVLQFYDLGIETIVAKDNDGNPWPTFDLSVFDGIDYPGWYIPRNLELFAQRSSPLSCFEESAMVYNVWGVHVAVWCGFPAVHMEPEHLALKADGKGRTVGQLEDRIDPLMRLAGYERIREDTEAYGGNNSLVYFQLPLYHTRPQKVFLGASTDHIPHATKRLWKDMTTHWLTSNSTFKAGGGGHRSIVSSLPLMRLRAHEMAVNLASPKKELVEGATVVLPKYAIVDELGLPFPHAWYGDLMTAAVSADHLFKACNTAHTILRTSRARRELAGIQFHRSPEEALVAHAMEALVDVCPQENDNAATLLVKKMRRGMRH